MKLLFLILFLVVLPYDAVAQLNLFDGTLSGGIESNFALYTDGSYGSNNYLKMDYVKGKNINEFMELNRNFVPYEEVVRMATQISSALAYCHEDVWLYRLDRNKFNIPVDPEDKDKVIVTAEERKKLLQELKIIHNDIHSGNIMRREDGNFVLLDFGLSFDGDEVVLSSSRQNGGALAFKPPEKWNNKTSANIYFRKTKKSKNKTSIHD